MKKIGYFAILCLYALGLIGGVGYACYNHAYLIAIGVGVLGWLAFPQVRHYYRLLTDAEEG